MLTILKLNQKERATQSKYKILKPNSPVLKPEELGFSSIVERSNIYKNSHVCIKDGYYMEGGHRQIFINYYHSFFVLLSLKGKKT